jgi:hypothetical protein
LAHDRTIFTRRERQELAWETACDDRTIRRWERGDVVKDATRHRLEAAAKKLKFPVPMRGM